MSCVENTCLSNVSFGENYTLQCGGNDVLKSLAVSFNPLQNQCGEDYAHNSIVDSMAASMASLCANTTTVLSKYFTDNCEGEKICEVNTTLMPNASDSCVRSARIEAVCGEPAFFINQLSILAGAYIVFVAIAMGCSFPASDFVIVFRNKLKGVLIGFCSQFFFMPFLSYSVARAFNFDANFSIGLVLSGMAPGGSTSNLFTYIVDGNVALSIVMSFLSTTCEIFMLPLLWVVYISSTYTDKNVAVPVWEIFQASLMIIVPVIFGVIVRAANPYRNRCGCSARHNACICCCDPRSRSSFGETPPPPEHSGKVDLDTPKEEADLQPDGPLEATAEKHLLGSVMLTAPDESVPGSAVSFVSPYGTRGLSHVPWGVRPGERFVVPLLDPRDPQHRDCCFCFFWQWLAKLGAPIAVVFLAAAVYVAFRDNPFLRSDEALTAHVLAVFFQPVGCLFGFLLALVFWAFERVVPCCRCACGNKNAQTLDCRDIRAISIETGVQSLALMMVTVTLVFRGCQQAEVLVFIITAGLYYVFHSVWYVLFLRCCCMDWCNKTFDGDPVDKPVTFCGDCRCCLSPTAIRSAAEPVDPDSLSQYAGVAQFKTTDGTAELPIRFSKSGPASAPPVTIISLFQELLQRGKGPLPALRTEFPDPEYSGNPATDASMPATQWRTWSFQEYYDDAKTVARALLSLGLERHASVNIWGFNSPQWVLAEMGAIFAGGKAAGIYPTDTAQQIVYKIQHSNGQVVAVQDAKKFQLLAGVAAELPNVKAVVCWGFQPTAAQKESVACEVLGWTEFLSLGSAAPTADSASTEAKSTTESYADLESALQTRMTEQRPGHCCALIYTSGTTGQPKAVMMSHDNLVFEAGLIVDKIPNCKNPTQERALSYLPLSHVAGMMLDILFPLWATARTPAHVTLHFARTYDLSKGTLAHRLRAVQPTIFLGVPRVWEKIQAKIKSAAAANKGCCSCITRCIVSCAKGRGARRARNLLIGGSGAFPIHFSFAKSLVLDKVAAQLGLSECRLCLTGAAPIGDDTLEFFGALGLHIMEAYGMSECSGLTTMSTEDCHMWGSCGFAPQSLEVKIFKVNEDGSCGEECPRAPTVDEAYTEEGELKYQGEICFRGRHIMMGYLANPDMGEEHVATIQRKTDSAIDDDGWLHSGDKGIITSTGMVKVTGRYKELLIGAGGENVAPVPIENAVKLAGEDVISNVMMFGDKKPFLSALVTLKAKGATGLERGSDDLDCRFPNSSARTVSEAMADPAAIKHILAAIEEGNEKAPNRNSRIRKFTILPYDFSVEGEELTSTLKLKRSVTLQHFAEVVARVYTQKGREPYVPFHVQAKEVEDVKAKEVEDVKAKEVENVKAKEVENVEAKEVENVQSESPSPRTRGNVVVPVVETPTL